MRKKIFYLVILWSSLLMGNDMSSAWNNLMPRPARQTRLSDSAVRLSEHFRVGVFGFKNERLLKGATRMLNRLRGRSGLFIDQPLVDGQIPLDSACMRIRVQRAAETRFGENEDYSLKIASGLIELSAENDIGALRGMETFLQLLSSDDKGYFFPAVEIRDHPRFPWRGLLIDACRHFMPVEVIKRNLDGMAAVKLNVLHWHLSEDQGFRVECKTFPLLHEKGSDGLYYTQNQIKEIIQYADDRGIRIMPEFDLPGHATSWLTAYPQYASAPGPYHLQRGWGIFDPTFDPTKEETYAFLDGFFAEMSQLFPDEYMHIGGDENNGKQWAANPQIRDFMKRNKLADKHALQSYFNNRLLGILNKYHKKMVGWDEILHPDMPTNIVIQSWRGRKSMVKAAQQGYQTLLSSGYYIDLIQPADYHYLNDPAPDDLPLTEAQKKLILGGEATMWSEMVSPETIDSRIWPRMAAIAERLWSPAAVRDVDDMYRRLKIMSRQLEELGLTHEKNYGMMLRRLSNGQNISALKTLVDVVEPVKNYNRNKLRRQFTYSPLTRVVDAARPDAERAREFRNWTQAYLARGRYREELLHWLQIWKRNDGLLQGIINRSPVLWEMRSLSGDLSKVALLGIVAMQFIETKKRAPESWHKRALKTIERARVPRGQVELMILPAIEALVKKASA